MYRHGIYVSEQETSMIAPLNGTAGLQVVIGTAPVHLLADPAAAINKPLLVYSKAEAIAAVGYSDDFASFTLCEAISASFAVVNVAPLVLINVLDPAKHSAEMEEKTVQINSGVAVVEETGVLLSTLVVKNGEETLTAEEDYTAVYNADGTVSIVLIEGGKADGATNLTDSGKKVDASKVTAADFVGGVDRRVAIGKPVVLGPENIPGVIGLKAIHLVSREEGKKVPKTDSMYIDIGAADKDEALALVQPGTYGSFLGEPEELGEGMLKAKAICELAKLPAIADDSGLCVDALNGGPGVYSARYGGEGLDDKGRYTLLLQNLRGQTTRAAHFTCAIACAFPVAISCSHLLDEGGQLLFIFLLGRGVDIAGDALSIDDGGVALPIPRSFLATAVLCISSVT